MVTHPTHPNLLLFSSLMSLKDIKHFSTTRNGGVSDDQFKSFNLGRNSNDSIESIRQNRNRLAKLLSITSHKLIIPLQTHDNKVLFVDNKITNASEEARNRILQGYDATITQERKVFLCVTTADCSPILLFDQKNKAIAAIHSGWRGIVSSVINKTLSEMEKHFGTEPRQLIATIGPSISIENYEVGNEIIEKLRLSGYRLDNFNHHLNPKSGKYHIDIKQLNKQKLIELGVAKNKIEVSHYCTFKHESLFFSARRQGTKSGRMLTGIMLQ